MAKKNGENFEPTIKVSNNPSKVTNPGVKQVYRFFDTQGNPLADLLTLVDEPMEQGRSYRFYHPMIDYKHMNVGEYGLFKPLLSLKMKEGQIVSQSPNLRTIQSQMKQNLSELDSTYKRLKNPHEYKISLSKRLKDIKGDLLEKITGP